ncbi:MAG: HEPN domain-containing protein [Candidatus Jordarchaeales archaeon]
MFCVEMLKYLCDLSIVNWGVVLVRRDVFDWFEEAREELETAEQLFRLGRYAHSCFHSQQAAEKALKALIIHLKRVVHRSHDLVELYEEVREELALGDVVERRLPELSAYYTQSRYPNAGLRRPSAEIGEEQAERCLEASRGVLSAVAGKIGAKI